MSLFITFEGGEGCGKSVQARALYRRLSRRGVPVLLTREPGGTPFGEKIARWLKWANDNHISPLTELLLFNASRSQMMTEVVDPGLTARKVVICDRYTDSTVAYQGYGRGLDLQTVVTVNYIASQGWKPDLTVLLDMPVEEGLQRKHGRKLDRFEAEDLAFHQRVRDGYLKLATNESERWLVVDARQSKAKIEKIIWQRVEQLLSG